MSKNKLLDQIAFTLFRYHHKITEDKIAQQEWDKVEHKRDLNIYAVDKSEYYRMAKGVYSLYHE